jgi:hypothetical protein
MAESCEVDSITDLKCKYCKGFYFPLAKEADLFKSNGERNGKNKMGNKGGMSEAKDDNKFICGLCGAINDIKNESSFSKLPKFK